MIQLKAWQRRPAPLFAHDIGEAQAPYDRSREEVLHELERAHAVFACCGGAAPRTGWSRATARPFAYFVEQGRVANLLALNATIAAAVETGTIAGVAQASEEAGAAASQVLSAASGRSRQSEHLGAEVERFLATLRAA